PALRACGSRDVVVVRGYGKEQVTAPGVRFVDNERYETTGELHSLFTAESELSGPVVLLYGDLIFDRAILEKLLATNADVAVVVDRSFPDAVRAGEALPAGPPHLLRTATPRDGRRSLARQGWSGVLRIGPEVDRADAHGEFIGIARLSASGVETAKRVYRELAAQRTEGLERASLTHLLQAMIDRGHAVVAADIHKGWMEIDSFDDYRRAWANLGR